MKKYICLLLLIAPMVIFSQQALKGKVVDDTNFPLPGASVIIKGTTKGVVTNIDGEFELELSNRPSTIVVSYLGFKNQEIVVDKQTQLNIVLAPNEEQLNEIVVIGYGQVEKGDLTGAVTSVKPKQDIVATSQNVETLLQGRAAGVLVQQNTAPGSPTSIKIRGLNSLTGNTEPLYVIDGIIVDSATEDTLDPLSGGNSYLAPQGGITGINPRDVESIEILKDASATAIYGSRGANGVVLITTKKGKTGETKFNFSHTTTLGYITNNIDVLDLDGYVNYQNDARANQGFSPSYYTYPDGSIARFENSEQFMIDNADSIERLEEVDWSEDTYKTAITRNFRISASGGTDNGNYYIAAGYLNNEGIVPNAFSNAADFNANFNNDLTSKLTLSAKVSAAHTKNSSSKGTENLGGTNNNLIRQVVSGAPFLGQVDNFEGDLFDISLDGPRAWISDYDDISKESRLLGALKLYT